MPSQASTDDVKCIEVLEFNRYTYQNQVQYHLTDTLGVLPSTEYVTSSTATSLCSLLYSIFLI